MSNFLVATRNKFRFATPKGHVTVEDLWDLPLTSKSGADLNTVAQTLYKEAQEAATPSFVAPVKTTSDAALKLEVVKEVIAVRLAEAAERAQAADKAAKKQTLLAAIQRKQEAAVESLSLAELQAMVDAL